MSNQVFLRQARDGIKRLIAESPSRITIMRPALVDDGAGIGNMVPDPSGTETEHIMTVRLSHERRQAPQYEEVEAGFSTNLSRFIMSKHTDIIYEGDTFQDPGSLKYFRIGPVDPLIKFSGTIAYQAPLIESEVVDADT